MQRARNNGIPIFTVDEFMRQYPEVTPKKVDTMSAFTDEMKSAPKPQEQEVKPEPKKEEPKPKNETNTNVSPQVATELTNAFEKSFGIRKNVTAP